MSITLQAAEYFKNAKGDGPALLSAIETKIMYNLRHSSIGALYSANPNKIEANGHTFLYRKALYPQTTQFKTTGNTKTVPRIDTIAIEADDGQIIKIEMDDFDLAGLASGNEGLYDVKAGISSSLIQGVSSTTLSYVDAKILRMFKRYSDNHGGGQNIKYTPPTKETVDTDRAFYRLIADAISSIEVSLSRTVFGVDRNECHVLIHPKYFNRIISGGMAQAPTIQSLDALATNVPYRNLIAGASLSKHPFLNQMILAGDGFSSDNTFDLSKLIGIVFAKDCFSSPMSLQVSRTYIDNDTNNLVYSWKYKLGAGLLRPDLIRFITL